MPPFFSNFCQTDDDAGLRQTLVPPAHVAAQFVSPEQFATAFFEEPARWGGLCD